jgi:hypothetical protein
MAQVIAVDISEEALKLAMDCGADYLVTAGGQQVRQVRDLTGPGADAVFDFVGEDATIGDSVAMLRPGGTYYLIGYGGTVTFPTVPLILGEISIVANLIGTGTDLADLVTLAGQGKVKLRSSSYPLEAASDAIQDLRHGRIHGRAILVPSTGLSTLASRSGGPFRARRHHMATLHIEHPITDFGTWKAAFDRFAEAREKSGVRGHRILRPVDDAHYVVVDLDFQTAGEAEKFLGLLQTTVWASTQSAPALAGTPQARILEPVEAAPTR